MLTIDDLSLESLQVARVVENKDDSRSYIIAESAGIEDSQIKLTYETLRTSAQGDSGYSLKINGTEFKFWPNTYGAYSAIPVEIKTEVITQYNYLITPIFDFTDTDLSELDELGDQMKDGTIGRQSDKLESYEVSNVVRTETVDGQTIQLTHHTKDDLVWYEVTGSGRYSKSDTFDDQESAEAFYDQEVINAEIVDLSYTETITEIRTKTLDFSRITNNKYYPQRVLFVAC